jgi:hypothetical protein
MVRCPRSQAAIVSHVGLRLAFMDFVFHSLEDRNPDGSLQIMCVFVRSSVRRSATHSRLGIPFTVSHFYRLNPTR